MLIRLSALVGGSPGNSELSDVVSEVVRLVLDMERSSTVPNRTCFVAHFECRRRVVFLLFGASSRLLKSFFFFI